MNYRLRFSEEASRDFDRMLAYISERSRPGARAWADAFYAAANRAKENPLACGFIAERKTLLIEFREFYFGTRSGNRYRAIFSIVDDEVVILYVRGPGQDFIDREPLRLP